MKLYQVIIPKPVEKQLDKLSVRIRDNIIQRFLTLKENPRPTGCVKLMGCKNEYRIRIGDYRVRYEIVEDKTVVVILHCLHRKDVYRK